MQEPDSPYYGGIAGRMHRDQRRAAREASREPRRLGRRGELQRLRDEAAALKGEAAMATAQRRQAIARRMAELTAEVQVASTRWQEDESETIGTTGAPARPGPLKERADGRSFFRSNAEYGMLYEHAGALDRRQVARKPVMGRRAGVRRGVDVRYPTLELAPGTSYDFAGSVGEEEARARAMLLERQAQAQRTREGVANKAFSAGQSVMRGHAPAHTLEPTLGFAMAGPPSTSKSAPERDSMRLRASLPAQRSGTPLAGQTQQWQEPAHSKHYPRKISDETNYAEDVYKLTGANPYHGRRAKHHQTS